MASAFAEARVAWCPSGWRWQDVLELLCWGHSVSPVVSLGALFRWGVGGLSPQLSVGG